MKNRREFTKALAELLLEMVYASDQPIVEDVNREAEQQKIYFDLKLTNCDGYIRKSGHQEAMCADLYLVTSNIDGSVTVNYVWDKDKAIKWHNRWVEMGGRPVCQWPDRETGEIVYDYPHFDGRD